MAWAAAAAAGRGMGGGGARHRHKWHSTHTLVLDAHRAPRMHRNARVGNATRGMVVWGDMGVVVLLPSPPPALSSPARRTDEASLARLDPLEPVGREDGAHGTRERPDCARGQVRAPPGLPVRASALTPGPHLRPPKAAWHESPYCGGRGHVCASRLHTLPTTRARRERARQCAGSARGARSSSSYDVKEERRD